MSASKERGPDLERHSQELFGSEQINFFGSHYFEEVFHRNDVHDFRNLEDVN
jgi:hypothetical protein